MPTLKVFLDVEIDGKKLYGFPLRLRRTIDEFQQFDYEEPDDGDDTTFSAIPLSQIATLQQVLVQAVDQDVGIRLEGGESGNTAIRISSGGLILIIDGTITNTNATVNNNAGAAANVFGFGGGT